jgi:Cytosol aminopeptidase family, N-terminal domain.
MRTTFLILVLGTGALTATQPNSGAAPDDVKETMIEAPDGLTVKVRMEGPYTADAPLQVVCYFKYTPERAKRMAGAPVELDKHLGGVIASLRERGEFVGDDLETLLIVPPAGSIKAKALLLVGLGEESTLSLEKMERVGNVALREAARLGVRKAAFAPLIRDQGNSSIPVGDVDGAVLRGVVLARDTENRLAKENLGKGQMLDEWVIEAGPKYFDEAGTAVRQVVQQTAATLKARSTKPYMTANP